MNSIKYIDGKGSTKIKDFKTEADLLKWLDKNAESIEVLAFSD